MKKFFCLLALTVALGALSFPACGGTEVDENDVLALLLDEIVGDDGVEGYSVRGLKNADDSEIVIPDSYKNTPITEISANAFVGSVAESVTLGANIKKIGKSAFAACEKLKSVKVGGVAQWCSVFFEDMGANPMYFATEFYVGGVLARDLKIPDETTKIPDFAFYRCASIKSVKTGGATDIGQSAFYGCENLESVELEGKITTMGELAFADCPSLRTLSLGEGTEFIGEYAFLRCGALGEVALPSSVKELGDGAFTECVGITSVKLGEGLERIGDFAFSGCSSLEEFVLPPQVSEIGLGVLMFGADYGFGGSADSNNRVTKITLSEEIREIPDFAFSYCRINQIALGKKVTGINYSAFYGCEFLESVIIPESMTRIDSFAFYKCSALKTVYYEGTAEGWSAVKIGEKGNDVSAAQVYFYSAVQPTTAGDFWHYGADGQPVKW